MKKKIEIIIRLHERIHIRIIHGKEGGYKIAEVTEEDKKKVTAGNMREQMAEIEY